MLDFNAEFKKFDERIKLTESKKKDLRISRDAIKDKIKKYHSDVLGVKVPSFWIQGSFAINTALNPIGEKEVDVDYGIYLNDQPPECEKWITPRNAHERVLKALEGHTQDDCISKRYCVRALYRKSYHLDLPVYIISNEKAYLAETRTNAWVHSDAKDLQQWFYDNRIEGVISRIVRYLKAWRDYSNSSLKSIEITIATVEYADVKRERDDLILYDTVSNMINHLSLLRMIYKPVAPHENLWGDYSDTKIDGILIALQSFKDDLGDAINASTYTRGSVILRELFGNRFPMKEDQNNADVPGFISHGAKPWGM